jgi:hypothetical protein
MAQEEPLSIVELDENLDEAEKPPELPNGNYQAEVEDVQEAVSAQGNAYYPVRFRIPPEAIPPDYAEFFDEGAVLSYYRILKPNGRDRRILWNLKQFMKALGLPTNITTLDPSEWIGRPATVVLKQSAYQGEMRAGIVAVEAAKQTAAAAPRAKSRRR